MHVEPEPLFEHDLGNDDPVRDDDHRRGTQLEARNETLRLQHGNPESLGDLLRGGCSGSTPTSGGSVRSCKDAADLVTRGQPFKDVSAERRRGGDRKTRAHSDHLAPRTGCGLSLASAARRDSSSVRSMISTPSR